MFIDKLDVSRDMLEVSLIINSDEDPEEMQFYLGFESWTETGMNFSYSFSNPLLVSKGIHPDRVLCKIKERKLFQAKDSNETLKLERMYIQKDFPR